MRLRLLALTLAPSASAAYDPMNCTRDSDGHCDGASGGAWSYRRKDGRCRHTEANVPRAADLVRALPRLFPDVRSVVDLGGGPGGYLTGFRDAGLARPLVTIEPHPLGECLFRGVQQLATNIFAAPAVNETFDLAMSVEMAEHVPSELHGQLIAWLVGHARRWIIFTAAHPGQDGEGHVANREPSAWRRDFEATGAVRFEAHATRRVKAATRSGILHANLHVFRKLGRGHAASAATASIDWRAQEVDTAQRAQRRQPGAAEALVFGARSAWRRRA